MIASTPQPLTPPPSLDPQALIEGSLPRPAFPRGAPMTSLLLLAVVLWSIPDPSPAMAAGQMIVVLALLVSLVVNSIAGRRQIQRLAAEGEAVTAIDELVQLRRWPEAADLVGRVLGRPMLIGERRLIALKNLAAILARYHRFADARVVHDYLLDPNTGLDDPSLAHSVRVARAMAMLREDHLVDADRAMNELRREVNHARDAVRRAHGAEAAASVRSAGLVLLDLYRDAKTGHAAEAIEIYERAIPQLPVALGMRVADAHLLAAFAYDRLGRADDAGRTYADATALIPPVELHRRYPETAPLAERYSATVWPA